MSSPGSAPSWRRHLRQRLRRLLRPGWRAGLGGTVPLSDNWGQDRGAPIDRHYIEAFLTEHRGDIRGAVIEVRDSAYTDRFGTGVHQREVLDIDSDNPRATIVADLTAADAVPADRFDCFILTQTLQFIYDTTAALHHAHRMLRPGGVLLATVPAVSRLAPRYGLERDYWRFTPASCARLFGGAFGSERVTVRSYGNVRTGTAFLLGMAREELSRRELDAHDPYFPLILAVRAVKRPAAETGA